MTWRKDRYTDDRRDCPDTGPHTHGHGHLAPAKGEKVILVKQTPPVQPSEPTTGTVYRTVYHTATTAPWQPIAHLPDLKCAQCPSSEKEEHTKPAFQ